MKIIAQREKDKFRPITITIEVQTQDEANAIQALSQLTVSVPEVVVKNSFNEGYRPTVTMFLSKLHTVLTDAQNS